MDNLKRVKNLYKLIKEAIIGVEVKGIDEQIKEKEEKISELRNKTQNDNLEKEEKISILKEINILEAEIEQLKIDSGSKVFESIQNIPGVGAVAGQQAKVGNEILKTIGVIVINHNNDIREVMSELNSVLYDNATNNNETKNEQDKRSLGKIQNIDSANNIRFYDPLVVDLNNNIYDIDNLENGVYFDLDGDGLREKTAWASSEDALLAIDIDKNGKIDNGAELLGDDYILENGDKSNCAIDVLKEFDENNDGKIDINDTMYSDILIWKDDNHNGISDKTELKHLEDYNIKSINLNDENDVNSNVNLSKIKKTITYTQEINGEEKIGKIAEWDFNKDNIDVKDIDLLEGLDSDRVRKIRLLPNIRAFGKIRTLWNEMYLDKSDKILSLIEEFIKSTSFEERDSIVDNLLLELGDTEDVEIGSKGAYINAKYVKVLEKFTGSSLEEGILSKRRASIYKDSYKELKELYYAELLLKSDFKDIPNFFTIKDNKLENISLLNIYTLNKMLLNIENSDEIFKNTALVIKYFNSVGVDGFDDFTDYFANLSPEYLDIIAKSNTKIYRGTDNYDCISVYGDNATVIAGDGNDSINVIFSGHSGNEYFYGGKGNDNISGGRGSDTYFFNLGDGKDNIYEIGDKKDINVIVFGEGIEKENLIINRINSTDILIKIDGSDDEITIRGQIGLYSGISKIYFSNGDVLTDIEIKDIVNRASERADYIEGSAGEDSLDLLAGNDTIFAKSGNDKISGNVGDDIIYGEDGDDILYGDLGNDALNGGNGNDKLYGGVGKDNISGGYGDDILEGGQGNDQLAGYYGNDTYIFSKGDGRDIIGEYGNGIDKIKLSEDIRKEDILFERKGHDLIIKFRDVEDSIRIKNQFYNSRHTVEEIIYGNNEKINFDEMLEATNAISVADGIFKGAYNDDTFEGSDLDGKIYGYGGNDELTGNKGNDEIDGGYGNDKYRFHLGDGHDTISDSSGFDTLMLGEGIGLNDVSVNRINNSDIEIHIKNSSDKLTLKGQAHYNTIDKVEFINGDSLTGNEIRENANCSTEYDDYLEGSSNDDKINGYNGNDTIYAGYGDDILEGGKGDDTLIGNYGADTYIFSRGDGKDTINENYTDTDEVIDKLVFKDVNKEDVIITKKNYRDITFKIRNSEDEITIKDAQEYRHKIEEIHFADGKILTYDELIKGSFEYYGDEDDNTINTYNHNDKIDGGLGNDIINAGSGDDILEGGKGDDTLIGSYGADIYVFLRGDGKDTINENYTDTDEVIDKLVFKDINKEDVIITKKNYRDITFKIRNSEDEITIKDAQEYRHKVEEIHFADGEILTYEDLMKETFEYYGDEKDNKIQTYNQDSLVLAGSGDDTINSSSGDDELYGESGNDVINSYYGDDIIEGGKGDDKLYGYYGSDTYIFSRGDGKDTIKDYRYYGDEVDKIVFKDIDKEDVIFTKRSDADITIKVKDSEDEITIEKGHHDNYKIEEIHFADGEILTYDELMKETFEYYGDEKDNKIQAYAEDSLIRAEAGNDIINSGSGDDIIEGGKGDDKLNGGNGSDTYVFSKEDGKDIIENYDSGSSSEDKVILRSDILNTILERNGDNLDITYADSEDKITVKNWYYGSSYQIDKIIADDKYTITNKKVNLLIDAMAGFEESNNIDWKSAVKSNDEKAINILEQFWVKQD